MKVFLVKQWNECECDPPCNSFCVGYTIDSIYRYRANAESRVEQLYEAFIEEYSVT